VNSSKLVDTEQERCAVTRKPRNIAAVLFSLKLADNIHYKFRVAKLRKKGFIAPKHNGAKQTLTQNVHSRSFKVKCFGVSGKAIRD